MPTTTDNPRDHCPRERCEHRTRRAYHLGCRMPVSREAHRLYMKRRREGRLPVAYVSRLGTQRRMHALAAIGWTYEALAAASGGRLTYHQVRQYSRVGNDRGQTISVTNHQQVVELFNQLCMTPRDSVRMRLWAARRGWASPMAWEGIDIDDPDAVPDLGEATPQAGGFVPVDVDELVELYQAGRTLAELVRATARKESTLVKYLQDRGVVIRERYHRDGRAEAGRAA